MWTISSRQFLSARAAEHAAAAAAGSLQARRIEHPGPERENDGLSPTAIGFLVPLFLVFLIGPFLCVCLVRKRRLQGRRIIRPHDHAYAFQKNPETREGARKKLEGVTEVSSVALAYSQTTTTCSTPDVDDKSDPEKGEVVCTESVSLFEKECAICLSTLHAPSPPEPAKLPLQSPVSSPNPSSKPPSISNLSLKSTKTTPSVLSTDKQAEQILRLKICGHEFHAECLVSWCHLRKYSCPICRAIYWVKEEGEEGRESGEMAGSRRGSGAAEAEAGREPGSGSDADANHGLDADERTRDVEAAR